MTQQPQNEPPIPWHLGIYDAHCHPTDTMTSIADIPAMKATTLTIMATRGEDQDLVAETAGLLGKQNRAGAEAGGAGNARGEARVVPCFGWHPWFSHLIVDDTTTTTSISHPTAASGDRRGDEDPGPGREWELKKPHYKTVLAPSPDTQNEAFISALPSPIPLSQLITQTRTRLLSHPTALVGEIGLDRAFRLPNPWTTQELESRDGAVTPGSREGRTLSPYRVQLEHQKAVLRAQLRLAGELGRAVSVHSVQTHGVVFEVLKELWSGFERKQLSKKERRRRRGSVESAAHIHEVEDHSEPTTSTIPPHEGERKAEARDDQPARPFPPRICMHSYSGPVEPIKQFLHPSNPSDVYFSFSSVINFHGPSVQKAIDAVQAVPDDRILIESDMHTAGEKMDELLADVVRTVCWLRGWELEDGVRRLGENWRKFVFG